MMKASQPAASYATVVGRWLNSRTPRAWTRKTCLLFGHEKWIGLDGDWTCMRCGKVKHFVTSITTGDYNYGLYPVEPFPPYLLDFAVGVKISKTKGELVIFIR